MAGELDDRVHLVAALELDLAPGREMRRPLVGVAGQPLRHRGLRRDLGVEQRHLQSGQAFDQRADQGVGLARAGAVEHQPALLQVEPDQDAGGACKGHRQQLLHDLVAQLAAFLAARLAAFLFLDLGAALLEPALDDRARHGLALVHEAQDALAGDQFDQRAMGLAARRRPAVGLGLRRATGLERHLGQRGLHGFDFHRPTRGDAVDHHVLEQILSSLAVRHQAGDSIMRAGERPGRPAGVRAGGCAPAADWPRSSA